MVHQNLLPDLHALIQRDLYPVKSSSNSNSLMLGGAYHPNWIVCVHLSTVPIEALLSR